jgi:hypothetical protein
MLKVKRVCGCLSVGPHGEPIEIYFKWGSKEKEAKRSSFFIISKFVNRREA